MTKNVLISSEPNEIENSFEYGLFDHPGTFIQGEISPRHVFVECDRISEFLNITAFFWIFLAYFSKKYEYHVNHVNYEEFEEVAKGNPV